MDALLNNWYIIYIIASILSIVLIYLPSDLSDTADKIAVFTIIITSILSLVGFILFVIWLTKCNNKNLLKYIWIGTLVATLLGIAAVLFINNDRMDAVAAQLSGYTFVIFLGSIIAYFVKK